MTQHYLQLPGKPARPRPDVEFIHWCYQRAAWHWVLATFFGLSLFAISKLATAAVPSSFAATSWPMVATVWLAFLAPVAGYWLAATTASRYSRMARSESQ